MLKYIHQNKGNFGLLSSSRMWLHELGGASADVTMAGRSVIDLNPDFLTSLGKVCLSTMVSMGHFC